MLLTATASVGTFSACSNEDINPVVQPTDLKESTTMSVQFALQLPKQNRAADDKQNTTDPGYNYAGKWIGNDLIESVDIYIFKEDAAAPGGFKLEKSESLDATKIDFESPKVGDADKAFIRPKRAFKVDPGKKRVFVVVNPNAETKALLNGANDFTAFVAKYDGVMALKTNGAEAKTVYTKAEATTASGKQDPFTVADHLAKVKDQGTTQAKDVIVMTGAYGEIQVEDNVTEGATLNSSTPKNRASVTVQRAVARVLVTTEKASYEIKGDNPETQEVESGNNAVLVATITDLTYTVAQGESSLYFNQQNSEKPTNYQYKTPNSAYLPKGTAEDPAANYGKEQYKMYDYTGLWRNMTNKFGGYDVPTNADYEAEANKLDNVVGSVKNAQGLHGEFILPNTHPFHATDREKSGYRKGNTAYVLVRGKIQPEYVYMEGGTVERNWKGTHAEEDLFLGDDGKFYQSQKAANDPTTNGNAGAPAMKVKRFEKGKVLYFVWVNPDHVSATEWMNSPAIRNNIYHIQIAGIANYVYNWNPLVPNPNEPVDPNKPVSPENPRRPNNPNNPDPQPGVVDPKTPGKQIPDPKEPPAPIKPDEPLSLKEAWMSVDVTILPWQVHTAKVILQ